MNIPRLIKVLPRLALGVMMAHCGGNPSNPSRVENDPDLNKGNPVRVVCDHFGQDTIDNPPAAYVTSAIDSASRLWYLSTNPWAVEAAAGSITVEYTGTGSVIFDVDLRNIVGSFGGYPSIIYGRSPWNGALASDQQAEFPIQVNRMIGLASTVNYSMRSNRGGGNVAYDLWLTGTPFPDNPNGGLEVMVWLWQNNTGPLGTFNGRTEQTILLNNVATTRAFNIFVGRGSSGSSINWDVVSFVMDASQIIPEGRVGVDLLSLIRQAGWAVSRGGENPYVHGIELGREFTAEDQTWQWEIRELRIEQTLTR